MVSAVGKCATYPTLQVPEPLGHRGEALGSRLVCADERGSTCLIKRARDSTLSSIEGANRSAKMMAQGHVHVALLLLSFVQWGKAFIAVAPNQRATPLSRWELDTPREMALLGRIATAISADFDYVLVREFFQKLERLRALSLPALSLCGEPFPARCTWCLVFPFPVASAPSSLPPGRRNRRATDGTCSSCQVRIATCLLSCAAAPSLTNLQRGRLAAMLNGG